MNRVIERHFFEPFRGFQIMVLDCYDENVAIYGTLGQTLLFNLFQTLLTVFLF